MYRSPIPNRNTSVVYHRGFTLIEVLVALVVLAIALAAAFRAANLATDGQVLLKERTLALWIAQNRLAIEQLAAASLTGGQRTGMEQQAGENFIWTEAISGTPNPTLAKIEISVARPGNPDYALAKLVGYLSRVNR